MKKFLITLLLIAIPSFVLAVPTSVDRVTNFIQPLIRSDFIKATYFTATSTSQASTFPYASSTAVTVSGALYNTSLSNGCLNITTGLIGSTGSACGAGSSISPWATTTSTVSGRPVLYPIDDTYIATVGSNSTTTAEFYFDPNLNIATIGANPSFLGGKVYTNGLFTTPTQLMLTDSVNDLQSNMVIGNTYSAGDGYYATGGITFVNGRSTQGTSFQTSNYYTYMGLSGPNFVAFTGLPPNGFVINNTDGPIIYGATSANVASSTQCWAIGSGFAVANYDMCLKNVDTAGSTNTASGGLGIGTTSPWARLAIAASSTATFPYFVVAQHINGVYTNASPVFMVHQNENTGIATGTPWGRLSVNPNGITGPAFVVGSSTGTSFIVSNGGAIGIGNTDPATKLDISGTNTNTPVLRVTNNGSGIDDSNIRLVNTATGLNSSRLDFQNNIGTSHNSGGSLFFTASDYGSGFNSTVGFWNYQAGNIVFATSNAEKVRLTSAGQLGVATTTPNNLLDIYSTSKSAIGFSGASGNNYKWTIGMDVTNGGRFSIASSTALGTTDRLVIDGAGDVGIASTSPWKTLSVVGTMAVNGLTSSTAGNAVCILANKEIVDSGGATCALSTKSSKDNIAELTPEEVKNILLNIKPVSFNYKETGDRRVGFLAEDVAKVDTRLVDYARSDINYEAIGVKIKKGEPVSVQYANITAVITKFIQGFYTEFQSLVARVSGLEKKVNDQEQRIRALELQLTQKK